MKHSFLICLILALFATSFAANAQFVEYEPFRGTQRLVDDGIYEALVVYSSHTGYQAKYVLDVRVSNDKVTAIYFPNGGSIHTGSNNEGYYYEGGVLDLNYAGDTAITTVRIKIPYETNPYYMPGAVSYYTDTYTVYIS